MMQYPMRVIWSLVPRRGLEAWLARGDSVWSGLVWSGLLSGSGATPASGGRGGWSVGGAGEGPSVVLRLLDLTPPGALEERPRMDVAPPGSDQADRQIIIIIIIGKTKSLSANNGLVLLLWLGVLGGV